MKFFTFLSTVQEIKQLPYCSVILFNGKEHPLLFFSYLVSFLKKNSLNVKVLDASELELSLIKTYVETISFDGSTIYYITNIHELVLKKRQEWIAYVSMYRGPHCIMFFNMDQSLRVDDRCIMVELDQSIMLRDISGLRFLVHDLTIAEQAQIVSVFGAENISVSLDTAFLFLCYEMVLGKSVNEFFKEWVPHIIEPTHSLFQLSQYFFSKNNKKFLSLWARAEDIYLPPFWIAFWSDQLWRAYLYCELMQKKEYAEAKKAGYKLPFSLINKDWSSLRLSELSSGLAYLSDLDFKIKNGGSFIGMELFFNKFFSNDFN